MNDQPPDQNATPAEMATYLERQFARLAELKASLRETLQRIAEVSNKINSFAKVSE
jgi:hypothetical protein